VRRDGNCFYRALLFGRLEDLITRLHSKEAEVATLAQLEYDAFLKTVKDSLKGLSDLGYPDVCEDFQESMVELLQTLEGGNESDEKGKGLHICLCFLFSDFFLFSVLCSVLLSALYSLLSSLCSFLTLSLTCQKKRSSRTLLKPLETLDHHQHS
jgi:hypothetical protein